MEYQALEAKVFHGGITDNYIDCQFHQYEEADNLLLTVNAKLYTRPGSIIYDATYPQIPAGNQRINALIDHYNTLFVVSAKKLYYLLSGWQTLIGPTSNDVFTSGSTTSKIVSSDWNNHTFVTNSDFSPVMKIYRDNTNALKVRSAGLPNLASDPTIGGAAGANNYIYAFLYFYEYKVGTVTFNDFGPVRKVQKESILEPSVSTVNITGIPILANTTVYNWDTTNIKVYIYRTQNNGTSFTYVGSVTNGTTTFPDTLSDATIENTASLYTDSGQLESYPPPLCKCLHITDTIGLYGHVKEGDEILKNRIRQSIPADPDSCPETLYIDLDDNIVGISSAGQTPIVFCEKSIYRLDGSFDAQGNGLLQAQEIESTVGCISANSIVQIQRGVCFAGDSGFYFTDGYEVRKLSNSFNERYDLFAQTDTQKGNIYGTFDKNDKRVWWSVQEALSADVNKCYVLDTRYGLGIAGDDLENIRACFTTVSGGDVFKPSALIFLNNQLIRADTRGYLFKHAEAYYSDPLVDTTLAVASWGTTPIIWDYISFATSFGSSLSRKFVPRILVTAENDPDTNITIQINSINDIHKQTVPIMPIKFRKNWLWGESFRVWGDETEIWDFNGIIEEQRRFPATTLRCSYKQVQFTNGYTLILTSDDLGTATVNAATKTATLSGSFTFPLNLVGYYIYFQSENYQTPFLITSNTTTTITYSDSGNRILSGTSIKWTIRGYPKDEVLNLISFAMYYAPLGETQQYDSTNARSNPA